MSSPSSYTDFKVAVTLLIGGMLFVFGALGVGLIARWLSGVYQLHRTAADYGARLEAEAEVRLSLVHGGDGDLARDAEALRTGAGIHRIEKLRPSRRRRAVVWRREGRTPTI
jgi:hypothetical protein